MARDLAGRMDAAERIEAATSRSASKAHLIGPGFAPLAPGEDNFFATVAAANSAKLAGG